MTVLRNAMCISAGCALVWFVVAAAVLVLFGTFEICVLPLALTTFGLFLLLTGVVTLLTRK